VYLNNLGNRLGRRFEHLENKKERVSARRDSAVR
jgi:hypothetical protein